MPFVLASALTVAFALLAASTCHFNSDDSYALLSLRELGLGRFLLEPINLHFVPLHRLVTGVMDALGRFEFGAHVALLALAQVACLWQLRRLLLRLVSPWSAGMLVLWYAGFTHVGEQLMWWSSGLHRLPSILCGLICAEQYLAWRQDGRGARLLWMGLSYGVGLGFYAKSALVPCYLVAIELCLWDETGHRARVANLKALGGCVLAMVAYLLAMRGAMQGAPYWFEADGGVYLRMASGVLLNTLAGFVGYIPGKWTDGVPALLLFGFLAGWLVWRSPRTWVVVLLLVASILVHGVALAASDRGGFFGDVVVQAYRYYLEAAVWVVVLVALGVRSAAADFVRPARGWQVASAALLMLVGASSLWVFGGLLQTQYVNLAERRQFVDRLEAGLASERGSHGTRPRLVDGPLPKAMLGMDVTRLTRLSEFVRVAGYDVTVVQPQGATKITPPVCGVDASGEVRCNGAHDP